MINYEAFENVLNFSGVPIVCVSKFQSNDAN